MKESDTSLYAWEQLKGPLTLEDTDPDTAWTDLVRP